MFIRNKNKLINNLNIGINNKNPEIVNCFKYLGSIIEKHLNFLQHSKYITNKMAKKLTC